MTTHNNSSPDTVQMVADTIIEEMFAPHEIPLDDRLAKLYREVAQKVLDRLNGVAQASIDEIDPNRRLHLIRMLLGGSDVESLPHDYTVEQMAADRMADLAQLREAAQAQQKPAAWGPITDVPQASGHSGTYLGYRDQHGNEMHCANAFCPHQDKCLKGCARPISRPTRGCQP